MGAFKGGLKQCRCPDCGMIHWQKKPAAVTNPVEEQKVSREKDKEKKYFYRCDYCDFKDDDEEVVRKHEMEKHAYEKLIKEKE